MPECSKILDRSNRSASRRQSKKVSTSQNPGETERLESARVQTLAGLSAVYVLDRALVYAAQATQAFKATISLSASTKISICPSSKHSGGRSLKTLASLDVPVIM